MLVSCPTCAQTMRVPDDRGVLRVKCPRCSAQWEHGRLPIAVSESHNAVQKPARENSLRRRADVPAEVEPERINVPFLCGVYNRPFTVRLSRRNAAELFTVCDIVTENDLSPSERALRNINRLNARFASDAAVDVEQPEDVEVDCETCDFSKFACPHCSPNDFRSSFVRCGGCNKLVCDGDVTETRSGKRRFTCVSCGGGGIVSTTSMLSFSAGRAQPPQRRLEGPQTAADAPQRRLEGPRQRLIGRS